MSSTAATHAHSGVSCFSPSSQLKCHPTARATNETAALPPNAARSTEGEKSHRPWVAGNKPPSPGPSRCSGPTSPPHGGGEVGAGWSARNAIRQVRVHSSPSPPPRGGEGRGEGVF